MECKDAKYGLSNVTITSEENKAEGNKKCQEENNAILSRMIRDNLIAVIFKQRLKRVEGANYTAI